MNKSIGEAFKVGFVTALTGGLGVTTGHYWEVWGLAYVVVIVCGLAVAIIWGDQV